ncbi:S49 family peptidase [Solicola gregarius]|uniref:S49 family peptidase n=1 Tax=Solicola gregarius TaxID=2908642 RepID=A0AA46THD5_9ACTN|nr:S49 family peptidase [Solicola gregarius]UYM04879.1 S49 family peptidase [Solicola gregarius]
MKPSRRALDRLPFLDRTGPPLVIEVDLTRGLVDHPPSDPFSALRGRNTPLLSETIAGLRYAATDAAVAGAIVTVSETVTIAQAEELGAALEAFARSGKPTVATATSFGELGPGTVPYYLALHTDSIWLQPSGGVALMGVALEVMTLRGVLDKVDAEPQLGQRHEFKTAAEMIMSHEISGSNREMTRRIADSVVERIAAVASRRRGVDADSFAAAMDAAPVPAPIALERGLVDHLGYRADAYAHARREWGADGEITLHYAHRYARHRANRPAEQLARRRRPKVGVVAVTGGISTGRNGGGPLGGRACGSESVCAALRLATEDDSLEALVLRVDSPGGSYVASDAIRHAVQAFRHTGRPVVASMGGVAASGGYFVSMPCDAIVALPATLTGSIGVLGGKIALGRTFQRIGVTREAIGSGVHSTMFSPTTTFDDAQWAKVNDWLDEVYADFTTKAAEDRGMDVGVLEPLARGRVWTGADALERGLVDELGGLRTALDAAATRAGLDPDRTRAVPVPHVSPLQRLIPSESSESPGDAVATSPEGMLVGVARAAGLEVPGVLSLPWRLTVR